MFDETVLQRHIEAQQQYAEKLNDAENRMKNVPGWTTWDESTALAWFEGNLSDVHVDAITDLAQAKELLKKQNTAIRSLARMVLAMRDKLWPELNSET